MHPLTGKAITIFAAGVIGGTTTSLTLLLGYPNAAAFVGATFAIILKFLVQDFQIAARQVAYINQRFAQLHALIESTTDGKFETEEDLLLFMHQNGFDDLIVIVRESQDEG